MSTKQPQSDEIHDRATRFGVIRLHEDFPELTWETCYYWFLYEHCNYEATKSRLASGQPELHGSRTFPTTPDKSGFNTVNLGTFPAEIWQNITFQLDYTDLCSVRLTNSALADIAAESMVNTVRFDLSFESLERLRSIAAHEYLRKGVRTVTFEASRIAPICEHAYSSHFDEKHHEDIKPQPPAPSESTPQAQRLYARNLAKFRLDVDQRYAAYRKILEAQEQVNQGSKEHLFQCIDSFTNLVSIKLATNQCEHSLSERFTERYAKDCAIHYIWDSSQTPWQLENILRPGIKYLQAGQISPKFFSEEGVRSKEWLRSMFSGLKVLNLHIDYDEDADRTGLLPALSNDNLSYAISTAANLHSLTIGFTTALAVGRLENVIPSGFSCRKLRFLELASFRTTEKGMMTMLKLQPVLKYLDLTFIVLSTGTWRNLFRSMRTDLNLGSCGCYGTLEDSTIELHPQNLSIELWHQGEISTLSDAIDMYLTELKPEADDVDDAQFEISYNPVMRVWDCEFFDETEIQAEFGPLGGTDSDDEIDDSDLDDDMDDVSEDETMDTTAEEVSASNVKAIEGKDSEVLDDEENVMSGVEDLPAWLDVD